MHKPATLLTKEVCKLLSSVLAIEFEDVRNGNNFRFNLRDSTHYEAPIPKSSAQHSNK